MKIDRLLEIIIYLLNHDHVPASYLAERFHVKADMQNANRSYQRRDKGAR